VINGQLTALTLPCLSHAPLVQALPCNPRRMY
jgi:hypothetical protein